VRSRPATTPIVPVNTPNDRRWVFPEDYDWADLIDSFDKLRLLADPQSAYSQNGLYAMGRAVDDVIISAMFGTAKTGEAGGTSTTFPTSTQQVAVNYAASGNVGLTVDKLREARRILMENEVDLDAEPVHCAISAEQHDDLLGQIQVTSDDYNYGHACVAGRKGLAFPRHQLRSHGASADQLEPPSLPGVGAVWHAPRYVERHHVQCHAASRSLLAPVSGLPDGAFGATRTEEKKVVDILCAE
jgi:hypothetical protein